MNMKYDELCCLANNHRRFAKALNALACGGMIDVMKDGKWTLLDTSKPGYVLDQPIENYRVHLEPWEIWASNNRGIDFERAKEYFDDAIRVKTEHDEKYLGGEKTVDNNPNMD